MPKDLACCNEYNKIEKNILKKGLKNDGDDVPV